MANLLADGLAYLTTQLAAHASTTVTYRRGSYSASVRATLGQKLLKIDDGMGGLRIEWTDLDFLIPAADLVLNSVAITPARGDTIELTTGSTVQTFQVFPFGNEPPWRWADPHQSMARIHTKFLASNPVV